MSLRKTSFSALIREITQGIYLCLHMNTAKLMFFHTPLTSEVLPVADTRLVPSNITLCQVRHWSIQLIVVYTDWLVAPQGFRQRSFLQTYLEVPGTWYFLHVNHVLFYRTTFLPLVVRSWSTNLQTTLGDSIRLKTSLWKP